MTVLAPILQICLQDEEFLEVSAMPSFPPRPPLLLQSVYEVSAQVPVDQLSHF